MWINSADDFINPPELGIAEREAKRLKNGRFILIPISDQTHGHGTHTWAVVWQNYLAELLKEMQRLDVVLSNCKNDGDDDEPSDRQDDVQNAIDKTIYEDTRVLAITRYGRPLYNIAAKERLVKGLSPEDKAEPNAYHDTAMVIGQMAWSDIASDEQVVSSKISAMPPWGTGLAGIPARQPHLGVGFGY